MAMDEKLREQINKERAAGITAVARLEKQVAELCELLPMQTNKIDVLFILFI